MKSFKLAKDGFFNLLKGMGTKKDARTSRDFAMGLRITQPMAENLYAYNWLAAKVVDIPIDDATRKWRSLLIQDAEKKEEIEQAMLEYCVRERMNTALKWARVFGGAVIVMVVDGDQSEPLDIDNVKPGSLLNLLVLDRYNVTAVEPERDITSKNFGQPKYYTVVRDGVQIHHTRVLKFDGQVPTIYQAEQNNFWGLSVFTKMWDPIADSQEVSNSIASLVYESNIDVYRIAGFNEMVASNETLAKKRLEIAHEMKSYVNGIALDAEDEYDKKTNTFTTLPEIDDRAMQKVSGSSDIPVTRILGVSPAGQNATGESDMRNYYDSVQSIQENEIRPPLDIIDKVVLGSEGYTDEFAYVFNPLQQLSEAEQATVDLNNAQRDQVYLDQDVVEISDVMAQLAEKGTYVSIDDNRVIEELEEESLEEEFGFGSEEGESGQSSEEFEGAGESLPETAEQAGETSNQGSE